MLRNPGLRKSVEQPVLDLNFAASQIGSNGAPDSRIDFSRGSNAWFVDSDGLVKKSPHNLQVYSQDFGNAAWSKTRVTVSTNATTAPDGTLTADKIVETAETGAKYWRDFASAVTGERYFFSVFAKAAERKYLQMWTAFGTGGFFPQVWNIFDVEAGTITSADPDADSVTIEDVGNGWFRCTTSITADGTGVDDIGFGLWDGVGAIPTTSISYTGDGSSGLFVWGAQFSHHSTAPVGNPYIKTEGSEVYAARLDHDPSWFMSEAQEQNLLEYSEMLDDSYWTKSAVNVTANAETDPLGGTTAEYIFATSPSGAFPFIQASFDTKKGAVHTVSFYAKAGEIDVVTVGIRTSSGGYVSDPFNDQALTSEWQRFSNTFTATEDTHVVRFFFGSGAKTWSGDQGFYIWGTQIEVGSTASTYHRTTGAPYYGPGATPKGLLIEEQRANAVPYSEDFSASGLNPSISPANSVTITSNAALAPDGTNTATKLVAASASGNSGHLIFKIVSADNDTDVVGSVFVKSAGQRWAYLQLANTGYVSTKNVFVDLENGVLGASSDSSGTIEDYGNGWYRVSVKNTTDSDGGADVIGIGIAEDDGDVTFTGDDTNGIFVWGLQQENGVTFPTSYIQTTGTTLTRNADVAVMGPTTGGTELVTNGTFDTDGDETGWEDNLIASTVSGGVIALTCSTQYGKLQQYKGGDGAFTGAKTLHEGRRYRATVDVTSYGSGQWQFALYDDTNSATLGSSIFTSSGTKTFDFTMSDATNFRLWLTCISTGTHTASFDNVSVRELYPFEQYNPSEGTVVCEFDCVSATTKGPFHFYEGTGFRGWGIRVINDSGTIIDGISRDASGFNNASVTGVNVSNLTRVVASVNSSGHMVAGGSGNSGSNTGNTVSLPVDRLDIGSSNIGGSNTGLMSGHIRRLKYSTRFVTELEAKNLTDD